MYRIGIGEDIHKLKKNYQLFLGGVLIPSEYGLVGHSDADVVLHALIDALLGALSLGDIGQHFPNTDAKYKNISSLLLLEKVYQLVINKGYLLVNADITIILEKPLLSPYIPLMKEKVAKTLNTSISNISIKATTNEKLDSLGRLEACKATAVILLKQK
ncbi:MAG: 2-C-methyl-D-erythritol 2,4-cyclodiphosphate synthase [Bacilli bacterium]|jgi:2-C-methyl-D-erythritol 2,4-cyclodiphosphate synthase|nr:2-C-methyl-D-erythritol 2,4-cyclodiphosphate synthase [Erysipelotrichia bacterium]